MIQPRNSPVISIANEELRINQMAQANNGPQLVIELIIDQVPQCAPFLFLSLREHPCTRLLVGNGDIEDPSPLFIPVDKLLL